MQHHDSTPLTAAQLARLSPQQVAALAAQCARDAANGDHAAYVTKETLLDLWQQHRGLDNRAQAVADLMEIEITRHDRQRSTR
jgi:hypothetical protein